MAEAFPAKAAAATGTGYEQQPDVGDLGLWPVWRSTSTTQCPGFVRTEITPLNREQATVTADQAAQIVVAAATLPADAASGTFIDGDGPVAW